MADEKSLEQRLAEMTEFERACVAHGTATMHRFKPEPQLKHGTPSYEGTRTVESIDHAKTKAAHRP